MISYCIVGDVFEKLIDDSLCLLRKRDKYVYRLNETATFLWKLLKNKNSSKKMVEALSLRYKITYVQAKKDTEQFLNYYSKEGLIKKISD